MSPPTNWAYCHKKRANLEPNPTNLANQHTFLHIIRIIHKSYKYRVTYCENWLNDDVLLITEIAQFVGIAQYCLEIGAQVISQRHNLNRL